MSNLAKNNDRWKIRRTFMLAVVAFCMGVVTYSLWSGMDTKVMETAVLSAFLVIGGTVSSYVFGAAWHDINLDKVGRGEE